MDAALLAEALTRVALPGQLVVLALMLGCAVWTVARPGVLPVLALAACGLVWSRANSHLEGAILITFAPGRGLVVADLLMPAMLCVVLLAAVRRGRAGRARRAAEEARLAAGAARLAAAEAQLEAEEAELLAVERRLESQARLAAGGALLAEARRAAGETPLAAELRQVQEQAQPQGQEREAADPAGRPGS